MTTLGTMEEAEPAREPEPEPREERCLPPFLIDGYVRRVRRLADLSQRELARAARVHGSTIGRIEAGELVPSLRMLQRLLAVADLRLTVVDEWGRLVLPMLTWDERLDGAERRYPAHLDTILDPEPGEWWGTSTPPAWPE